MASIGNTDSAGDVVLQALHLSFTAFS